MADAELEPETSGHGARRLRSLELARLLERALNREIEASTAAADLLAELEGKSFRVELEGTGLACTLRAASGRVAVELAQGGRGDETESPPASATLRSPPLDLLRLLGAASVTTLKGTRAEVAGDLHVADRFAELLRHARPDLEAHLADLVGDVPAHALGEAARSLGAWLRRAAGAFAMNTSEYLQEESRALPAPLEVAAFFAEVERLRDDVDRAAARLVRLERR
jgi:ubiquinone biosynthesis accessory factor UbiJ